MKLVYLSVASIIGCLLGLVLLVGITLNSVGEVRMKQEQIAELLALQARINQFSIASYSLLLAGTDAGLLAAYKREGDALQQRLRQVGGDSQTDASASARKAAHRVGELVDGVKVEVEQHANPDASSPTAGSGALDMPARSRILMSQEVGLGGALNSALDSLLRERQRAIARERGSAEGSRAPLCCLAP